MKLSNKNHKGSALFTVVSVMMILMILVMGAFVLVSAAHQKAITAYYNNQSYITARDAIDRFFEVAREDTGVNLLKEEIIGKFNVSTKQLSGGINYKDPDPEDVSLESDGFLSVGTGTSEKKYYYKDFEIEIPNKNMGELFVYKTDSNGKKTDVIDENKIRVYRISATELKIEANVKSGIEGKESVRTVTKTVELTPNGTSKTFDSGLVATAGNVELSSNSQLFGGYINLDEAATVLDGSPTYYGNFYKKGNWQGNDGGMTQVMNLGSKAVMGADGSKTLVPNFFEATGNIKFGVGTLKVLNVNQDTQADLSVPGATVKDPYIFASGITSDINLTGNNITIGEYGKRVDIWAKGDIIIKGSNTEIYGDIHALGNVTISDGAKVHGTVFCNGVYNNSGASSAPVINNAYDSSNEPTPYNNLIRTDLSTQEYLDQTPYYKDESKKLSELFDDSHNVIALTADSSKWFSKNPIVNAAEYDAGAYKIRNGYIDMQKRPGFNEVSSYMPSATDTITFEMADNVDYFIILKNAGAQAFSKLKIIQDYSSCSDPSAAGNIYLYCDSFNTHFNGLYGCELGLTEGIANQIYDDYTHAMGTLEMSPSDEPSHLFLLINGSGNMPTPSNTTNFFHAYIYAPDFSMNPSNNGERYNGKEGFPTSSNLLRYDNIEVRNSSNLYHLTSPGNSVPQVIGSCIAAGAGFEGYAAVLYVEPGPNIFDQSTVTTKDDYVWTLKYTSNK